MVRLSVGMRQQVPTTDLTSVQDPFKDTNRLILPPLILMITIADEDEYISLLTGQDQEKTRVGTGMRMSVIKIRSNLEPCGCTRAYV